MRGNIPKKKKKKIWNKAYNKIMQFTPLQQNPQEHYNTKEKAW